MGGWLGFDGLVIGERVLIHHVADGIVQYFLFFVFLFLESLSRTLKIRFNVGTRLLFFAFCTFEPITLRLGH